MSSTGNSTGDPESASAQIDAIIEMNADWRGRKLADLRAVVNAVDPDIVEEVKWKKPSKPEGVPVWSRSGILCVADTLKNSVRLTFPKGASIEDPEGFFNSRLDSMKVRATDFHEGEQINRKALSLVVSEAIKLNLEKKQKGK